MLVGMKGLERLLPKNQLQDWLWFSKKSKGNTKGKKLSIDLLTWGCLCSLTQPSLGPARPPWMSRLLKPSICYQLCCHSWKGCFLTCLLKKGKCLQQPPAWKSCGMKQTCFCLAHSMPSHWLLEKNFWLRTSGSILGLWKRAGIVLP